MTWKVFGSRHVLRDRWISVRADDCLTASGVRVAPYYVLEYPDFVHVVALDSYDRVVLVRQYRHGIRKFSLELPGGTMDLADEDPIATARRELREETGYVGESFRLLASLSTDPAKLNNRLHLVLAESVVAAGPPTPDPAEEITTELVGCRAAYDLALGGKVLNAQHVALLVIGFHAAGRVTTNFNAEAVSPAATPGAPHS